VRKVSIAPQKSSFALGNRVGAIDWAVRDFHGYETPRGTTYNNYLILDDEITLIDTVKYDFSDITIKHIKCTIPCGKARR
jgi:flavorubredoxin